MKNKQFIIAFSFASYFLTAITSFATEATIKNAVIPKVEQAALYL